MQASKDPRIKHRRWAITETFLSIQENWKMEKPAYIHHPDMYSCPCTMHTHAHSFTHTRCVLEIMIRKKCISHINALCKISSTFISTRPSTHIPHPHLLWHLWSSESLEKQTESQELMQFPVQIHLCSVSLGVLLNFLSLNVFIIHTVNSSPYFQVPGYIQWAPKAA